MIIRRPLALLLGGIVSASSIGCTTFHAGAGVRGAREMRSGTSPERMVAIARVFENQGRLDRAEEMYRTALQQRPHDPVIRQHLDHVVAQRSSQPVAGRETAELVAMADQVAVRRTPQQTTNTQSFGPTTDVGAQQGPVVTAGHQAGETSEGTQRVINGETEVVQTGLVTAAVATIADSASPVVVQPTYRLPSSEQRPGSPDSTVNINTNAGTAPVLDDTGRAFLAPQSVEVRLAEVMAVVTCPTEHTPLLLQALTSGDCAETQTLAATLLGDCDLNNFEIRDRLAAARAQSTDHGLLLAIADSQIHRGEATSETAQSVVMLATASEGELQIQAVTSLRHFQGTGSEPACVQTLLSLLRHTDSRVRAASSVTLGDFLLTSGSQRELMLSGLTYAAAGDSSEEVRLSARAALGRHRDGPRENAEPILIRPAQRTLEAVN